MQRFAFLVNPFFYYTLLRLYPMKALQLLDFSVVFNGRQTIAKAGDFGKRPIQQFGNEMNFAANLQA